MGGREWRIQMRGRGSGKWLGNGQKGRHKFYSDPCGRRWLAKIKYIFNFNFFYYFIIMREIISLR